MAQQKSKYFLKLFGCMTDRNKVTAKTDLKIFWIFF